MLDCHHHIWDLEAVHYPWLMARDQVRFFGDPSPIQRNYPMSEYRLDAASSEICCSVHIQVGAEDPFAEARWVQDTAEQDCCWPAAQVVFCDLTDQDLDVRLDALQELPSVRGIRQIVGRSAEEDALTGSNSLLEDPRFCEGLKELAGRGLSFDLQLTPGQMKRAAEVFGEHPELKTALCHAGSPGFRGREDYLHWKEGIRLLAELDNMHCKLSGLAMFYRRADATSFRPVLDHCLRSFGPDKCMFGSNFPVDGLYTDYSSNFSSYWENVPPAFRDRVFHRNARTFYRLCPGGGSA
ncbi:MAG: amidohydrolase family protein [Rhodobacteraceae bacterium]|nr:amidohydrolase family protein [Paracoccaceae bacterium]